MSNRFIYIILMLFASCSPNTNSLEDEKAIIDCFEEYKTAGRNRDGKHALNYLSKNVVEFYNDLMSMAIYSDSSQLMELWSFYKIMIVGIRCEIPKEVLLEMSGEELIVYAFENNLNDMQTFEDDNFKVGSTEIDNNMAKAKMLYKGEEVEMVVNFYKEDGNWKVDLLSIIEYAIPVVENKIHKMGYDNNEGTSLFLLLAGCDSPMNPLWEPIIKSNEDVSPNVLSFFDSAASKK